jgi:hypothetical protein
VLLAIPHSEGKQPRYGVLRLIASYPGNVNFSSQAPSLRNALKDKHPLAMLRHDRILQSFPVFCTSLKTPPISLLPALSHDKPNKTTRDETPTSGFDSFQQIAASGITVSRDGVSSNVTAVKRRAVEHGEGPKPKKAHPLNTQELAIRDGSVRRSTRQPKLPTKP